MLLKESMVLNGMLKETIQKIKPIIQKVAAVEVQARVFTGNAGALFSCLSQLFVSECQKVYIVPF